MLESVPRIVKFELRDRSPKLHLATITNRLARSFAEMPLRRQGKHALQLAMFVQNIDTTMRHRLSIVLERAVLQGQLSGIAELFWGRSNSAPQGSP
jgi:hypothetical protein